MKHLALAAATTLFASLAFGGELPGTDIEASQQATVIVYRNDADIRSRRLSFDVHLGSENLGRMRDDVVVTRQPAGTYTLDTTLPGDTPIQLQLQPGATYYVQAGLSVRGGQVKVELEEVGEQVARAELGELPASTI